MVSRMGVIGWGVIASGLCCMCTGAYISYNFMGDVLSVSAAGAVFPIFFSLLWNGCTAVGACVGMVIGKLPVSIKMLPPAHLSCPARLPPTPALPAFRTQLLAPNLCS